MVRQKKGGGQYYYEFMSAGKRYYGVCEGCHSKRAADAYEKRMRDRAAAFAEQKSVDRLMERRRQELTGRKGINFADAFDLALQKPRRRSPSQKVIEQKRSIWMDFSAFMAEKHPEVEDIAAVTSTHAEEYIALIRSSGRFLKTATYQRGKRTVTITAANGAPSNRTATLFQTVCAEVFKLLARDAGISESPFAGIAKPPKAEESREAFTPDELRLICENLDTFTQPLFTVAFMTALREGDICTLRWSDIDFQSRVIRRVMNKTGRRVEIPIADRLLVYLNEQYIMTGEGEFVFPEHAEMYKNNRTGVSLRIKVFLEELGIKTTRTPAGRSRAVSVKDLHSCRHTFCYYAGMKGIPLAVVQSIVGHMSPEMTAHYTAHATLEDKRRGIENMPEFIAPAEIPFRPVAMIGADAERAALLREIEALSTEEIKSMLEQRGTCGQAPINKEPDSTEQWESIDVRFRNICAFAEMRAKELVKSPQLESDALELARRADIVASWQGERVGLVHAILDVLEYFCNIEEWTGEVNNRALSDEVQDKKREIKEKNKENAELREDCRVLERRYQNKLNQENPCNTMTIKEAADIWGVSTKTISRWDKGIGTPELYPPRNVSSAEMILRAKQATEQKKITKAARERLKNPVPYREERDFVDDDE